MPPDGESRWSIFTQRGPKVKDLSDSLPYYGAPGGEAESLLSIFVEKRGHKLEKRI